MTKDKSTYAPWASHAPWAAEAQDSEPVNLRSYLLPIQRRWWLIVALVAIVTGGTYAFYASKPKVYSVSTDVLVGGQNADLQSAQAVTERQLQNMARVLRTAPVAREVAKRLKYKGPPTALLGHVSAAPATDLDVLTITAVAGTGRDAAMLANTFADAFLDLRIRERRSVAKRALADVQRQLDGREGDDSGVTRDLRSRAQTLVDEATNPTGSATRLDQAGIPGVPISPKPRQNATFAFALSLVLGVLAAFALERLDRRIRSLDDVEAAYGARVIGAVPHAKDLTPIVKGEVALPNSHREVFRTLKMSLGLASAGGSLRTLLVTSAVPLEGKSTLVRNLALVYREAGLRVAVLDADLRRPTLARLFNVTNDAGITDFVSGSERMEGVMAPVGESTSGATSRVSGSPIQVATKPSTNGTDGAAHGNGRLEVITSGSRPSNPLEVVATQEFQSILRRLSYTHDIVLIDTPPLLAVSDAVPLISEVDGTIVVSRLGHSTHAGARQVADLLSRIPNANVLGVVANDVPDAALVGGQYDHYGA